MAALTNQPTNPQFLSPVGFNFSIRKIPNVNYFVQAVNLPGVQLGEAEFPTPFRQIPLPGDHLTYGELALTFKVDENMENYIELYNWLQYLGYPESFAQSKEIYEKDGMKGLSGLRNVQRTQRQLGQGGLSDAALTILNSASNPNISIEFEDCFPTSLSDLQFDIRVTDIDFLEAQCTFRYKLHKLYRISSSGNSNTSVGIAG
jgi:hypothetical protein